MQHLHNEPLAEISLRFQIQVTLATPDYMRLLFFRLLPVLLLPPLTPTLRAELNLLGYVEPRHAQAIADSPWGVQSGDNERVSLLSKAGELGVKWTRFLASWRAIEKEEGRYQFSIIDEQIDAARANGITPFVCFDGGNALYSGTVPHPDPQWRLIYGIKPAPPILDEKATEAWLRFVDATIAHAKDRVTHWEIWNEPNHYGYWGAPPDAAAYGRLARLTAERIRAVQPDAIIIAGALAGLDPAFVEDFLKEDTGRLVDVVSFHNYGPLPEERMYRADETWRVLAAHNPRLKLWQGECGYGSHSSTKDYRGNSPWGYAIQAKWLLRQAFVDHYFMRADLSVYFKLFDGGDRNEFQERPEPQPIDRILGFPVRPGGARVRGKGVNEKCLLANPTLEPKPAFYAYRNLTAVLDSRYQRVPIDNRAAVRVTKQGQFAGIGVHDDAFPSIPLVTAYRTAGGKALLAYWLPWHPQEYTPRPAQISLDAAGLRFEEPVLVDLLTGAASELPAPAGETFDALPLQDYPLVIAERSELQLSSRPSHPSPAELFQTGN